MERETVVLCGANSYEQKYYFNRDFAKLPEGIQQELQVMCVLFTEDVGGVLTLEFSPEGVLEFKVQVNEQDYLFDEIGSELKIREYQREKRELLEALEMFYRVFFMGIDVGEVERMNLDKMGIDELNWRLAGWFWRMGLCWHRWRGLRICRTGSFVRSRGAGWW